VQISDLAWCSDDNLHHLTSPDAEAAAWLDSQLVEVGMLEEHL